MRETTGPSRPNRDKLHLDDVSLPDSTLLALPGRRLASVLEHALHNGDAIIADASSDARSTTVAFTETLTPFNAVVPRWRSMLPDKEQNR